jgi:hypothetical protein
MRIEHEAADEELGQLKAEVRRRFLAMPRVQKAAAASGLCPVEFVDEYDYEPYLPHIEDALGLLGDDFETLCQWETLRRKPGECVGGRGAPIKD